MTTCPHCGAANDSQAFYCEKCGYTIQSHAESDLYTIAKSQAPSIYEETQSSALNTPYIPPTPPISYERPASEAQNVYYNPYSTESAYTPSYNEPSNINTPYAPISPVYTYPPVAQGRSAGGIILSIVLYLFGLSTASFGAGGFTLAFTDSDTSIAIAFLAVLLLGLVILIPVMILRKKPLFKWWVRLLIVFGLAVIGFIALIIAAGISDFAIDADKALDIYLGGILFVFGALISLASVL